MKMISPRLQQTALLGALLVAASFLASSRSVADTGPGGEEFYVVTTPGNPGPGPAAGLPKTGGRGSQLLLQLRGSSWGRVQAVGWGRELAPVLAQLDEIEGVEFSSSNRSGALVKLSLKPGADPAKVAEGAQRVLTAQVADRVPVPLGGRVAAAAVQGQEWWDHSQVAELVATGIPPSVRQSPTALPVLLLWWLVVALGLCWWQRRRMLAVARRRGLLA